MKPGSPRPTIASVSIGVPASLSPPDSAAPGSRKVRLDRTLVALALLGAAAALTVLVRDGPARFAAILLDDLALFGAVAPNVLAGSLIGAFVGFLLPREVVTRWVGAESRLKGVLIASALGAAIPGGPFTIYPIAAALLVKGADAGAAIALITSWTLLGYSRVIVWELPFLGFDFVAWRMLAALPLPIVAGLLARLAVRAMRRNRP